MGVRESAAQGEEFRLQNLTLETKERSEGDFDPEKEMTEEDWKNIEEYIALQLSKEGEDFLALNVLDALECVKQLSSQRFRWIKENPVFREGWQRTLDGLRPIGIFKTDHRRDVDYEEGFKFINNVALACGTFPEQMTSQKIAELGFTDERYRTMKEEGVLLHHGRQGPGDMMLLVSLMVIYPEKQEEISAYLDDTYFENIKKGLGNLLESNPSVYLRMVAAMRALRPQQFKEFSPSLSDWEVISNEFYGSRKHYAWFDLTEASQTFLRRAADIKVLAAEKVEVTGEGIKMTMPSQGKFKESVPVRPERKQF